MRNCHRRGAKDMFVDHNHFHVCLLQVPACSSNTMHMGAWRHLPQLDKSAYSPNPSPPYPSSPCAAVLIVRLVPVSPLHTSIPVQVVLKLQLKAHPNNRGRSAGQLSEQELAVVQQMLEQVGDGAVSG